jgi:hypothetical protein
MRTVFGLAVLALTLGSTVGFSQSTRDLSRFQRICSEHRDGIYQVNVTAYSLAGASETPIGAVQCVLPGGTDTSDNYHGYRGANNIPTITLEQVRRFSDACPGRTHLSSTVNQATFRSYYASVQSGLVIICH